MFIIIIIILKEYNVYYVPLPTTYIFNMYMADAAML